MSDKEKKLDCIIIRCSQEWKRTRIRNADAIGKSLSDYLREMVELGEEVKIGEVSE